VDVVTVAFGVRNFSDLGVGLTELARVLRPEGALLVLEFSRPQGPLAPLLGWWVRNIPPRVGSMISGDSEAYTYLPASVNSFAEGGELCRAIEAAGLRNVEVQRLTGGVASLYKGTR
jgi:demethylmenaquinone methyltransferase/2-methoxy-6-polyprenyl-1,4-benzoquinol methylase